jgi:hypothetical protein
MAAAKPANNPVSNVMKLRKPVMHDEKEIATITFDFDQLTGDDLEAVDDEFAALGKFASVPALSPAYQRLIACRACGISYEATRKMSAADVSEMCRRAQAFLLG